MYTLDIVPIQFVMCHLRVNWSQHLVFTGIFSLIQERSSGLSECLISSNFSIMHNLCFFRSGVLMSQSSLNLRSLTSLSGVACSRSLWSGGGVAGASVSWQTTLIGRQQETTVLCCRMENAVTVSLLSTYHHSNLFWLSLNES